MRNNQGFTLIELLAIIVILAIIAVITVPIILGIIDDAQKKAAKDSAYGYKDAVNKFYAAELLNNKDFSMETKAYSISELSTLGVSISGSEPDSVSWLVVQNNVVTDGCLQYGDYKVDLASGNINDAQNGECINPYIPLAPVSFSTDSWATIKNAVNNDNTSLYSVGDTKEVEIGGKTFTVRLINKTFDGCDTMENGFSQTVCGFVVEFVDGVGAKKMYLSNSNAGGWPSSLVYEFLNVGSDSFYNEMPFELKSVIADTYTVSGHGADGSEQNYISTSKLYILSYPEINGVNPSADSAYNKSKSAEYYATAGASKLKYRVAGVAYSSSNNTGTINYWTRTAINNSTYYFYYVGDNGNSYGASAIVPESIVPAFRITKD